MFVLSHPHALHHRAGFHPAWNRAALRLLDERIEARSHVPAMDVSESETGYSLSFDLPGIVKDQVKVTIDGRHISVEATPADAAADTDAARIVYRERSAPRFARKVTLPVELDASTSKARFANGVLTLTLVKKPLTGPTTLAIE
jgi:HSP20 family protein